MPPRRIVEIMNLEDRRAAEAVGEVLDDVARAVGLAEEILARGGRLLYVGAGTSGRIAASDVAELGPTFGLPPGRVIALVAGGSAALERAVEGAEDDAMEAVAAIRDMGIGPSDCVVGITASGTTRFVLGAMGEARERGASTVLVTSGVRPASGLWHVAIVLDTGPEVLTGSTRLKAATAAKMVLNMISTAVMARLGLAYSNLMVEAASANRKLGRRAIYTVHHAAEIDFARATEVLRRCDGEVKTAVVSARLGLDPVAARARLAQHDGVLRRALEAR
jgi:N-acetylmuramic acid 6-phosphate etherase